MLYGLFGIEIYFYPYLGQTATGTELGSSSKHLNESFEGCKACDDYVYRELLTIISMQ